MEISSSKGYEDRGQIKLLKEIAKRPLAGILIGKHLQKSF